MPVALLWYVPQTCARWVPVPPVLYLATVMLGLCGWASSPVGPGQVPSPCCVDSTPLAPSRQGLGCGADGHRQGRSTTYYYYIVRSMYNPRAMGKEQLGRSLRAAKTAATAMPCAGIRVACSTPAASFRAGLPSNPATRCRRCRRCTT